MKSRSAKIDQFVGDAEYTLCLRIGELIALQEKLGVGPYILAQKLTSGEWYVEHVTETLRLALIGGGLTQPQAHSLVKNYCVEGYLLHYAPVAASALYAALMGVDDEPIAEEDTDVDPMTALSEMGLSDGANSTNSPEPLDSPPTI